MANKGDDRGAVFSAADERRLRRWAAGLAVGVFLAAAAGFLAVFHFAEANKTRDLESWRDRLTMVAEARAGAVDDWLKGQKAVVAGLARNATVQFFFTELSWSGKLEAVTDGEARLEIIRNLLAFTASETGFAAPPGGADIPANIDRPGRAGLAVALLDGRPVVSTAWMPKLGPIVDKYREKRPKADGVELIGPYLGEGGEATLAVVAPIEPMEGTDGAAPVGLAIGVRLMGGDLYGRVRQPADDAGGGDIYLVRRGAAGIDVLSPLKNGAAPLAQSLPMAEGDAAAFAVMHPGVFGQKRNYDGQKVLMVGMPAAEAPWTVVRTVDAKAALGEIAARRNAMLIILSLIIALLAVAGLMLWRHGASLRAAAAAAHASDLAQRYRALSTFLTGVMDAQPTVIVALTADGVCRFGNRRAGELLGQTTPDLEGKSLPAIFGRELGRVLAVDAKVALDNNTLITNTHTLEEGGGKRVLQTAHVPLSLPQEGGTGSVPGTLLVVEDVTDLVTERERREAALRQLVTTVITLIDSRDPYAARHSRWVAELARHVAIEMSLTTLEVETAELAGALLNLGKVLVRRDLLTKATALQPSELDEVRASVMKSAEILKGIDFDGPVVSTLEEVHAHWDGQGIPAGLKGEAIQPAARVLAVVNAFVGMVSARAHRDPLPLDAAVSVLMGQVGTVYDRRPVAALIHYLDNRGGRKIWEQRSRETTTFAKSS